MASTRSQFDSDGLEPLETRPLRSSRLNVPDVNAEPARPDVTASGMPILSSDDWAETDPVDDFFGDVADPTGRQVVIDKNAMKEEGQGLDEVQTSFTALKDSISQGRELKVREKERATMAEKLHIDKVELADRENILENYTLLATDQANVIAVNTQDRGTKKAQMEDLNAQIEEASSRLRRMQTFHAQQLQPLETALGKARAAADQAKNDERSRKSELNAVEAEIRKAEEGQTEILAAKRQMITQAYENAKARSDSAKDALKETEKAYEVTKRDYEGEEAPFKKTIDELSSQVEELKAEIADLDDTIDTAQSRKQYIDDVYRNPEQTDELRASIAQAELDLRQADQEADELRAQLEQNKEQAKKAKLLMAAIAVVIIIVIIVVIVMTH